MRLNTRTDPVLKTHEGGAAKRITPLQELRRSVMACLLWEDSFYESGESIADRICALVKINKPEDVSQIAIQARTEYKLRHVPLLLAVEMCRNFKGKIVGDTIYNVIQRADELTEILAIYWRNGRCPLSSQIKQGLARAWTKFNAYQLAKYNRDGNVKLRDSLFLCHAKAKDKAQEATWQKLINGTLESPDTWEVGLSTGGDKKETFTRLLTENKLGYMALLRNLRNMRDAGVDRNLIATALNEGAGNSKALPFRFIAAARAVPEWEDMIEIGMLAACASMPKLPGHTVIVVDCSGSMDGRLSSKSEMSRFEAAAALAILVREISEQCTVYAYGDVEKKIAPRRGMALRDALRTSGVGWSTMLGRCVRTVNQDNYDRVIIITDEQSRDNVPGPKGRGYVINVATYQNGIGYGPWIHIDGFSESVVRFIQEYEAV